MRFIVTLVVALIVFPTMAQQSVTISGTVKNTKGESIVGANVYVKDNQKLGVVTDKSGAFTLTVPAGSVVIFNFITYETFEYNASKSMKNLNIVLKEGSHVLDEAVISTGVGGTQRKVSIVGAISTIEAKDLQVPALPLTNILGGRIAGVITQMSSGEPGKNIADFKIRGISTFGANSAALVLIDGLEGDINSVDPADIESFSVLKDASATAVYGVRGANGVVLITTKKGKEGKIQVTGRVNYTLTQLKRMPCYMRAYEYAKLANEARVVRGDEPIYSPEEMDIIKYGLDKDLYPDVDWQREVLNPFGFQQTYYASARGGGKVASYFLSLGTSSETAAYKMDPKSPYKASTGFNTYNYRGNIDMNITPKTRLYFGSEGYLERRTSPGANTDNLWAAQSQLTPLLIPKVYSSGQLPAYGAETNFSPYVMLNYTGKQSNQKNSFLATLALFQDLDAIAKGLNLRVQGAFNADTYFNERRWVLPEMYYAGSRDVNGNLQLVKKLDRQAPSYSWGQNQYRKYHLESTLNYDKLFAEVHRFSALLYYYMNDSKNTSDISNSLSAIPFRYQGISGRITYGFRDTYFLDLNFGYTGSENFQKGRRFGFFPSVAGGWVPSSYTWVKEHLPWLSFLKLRGSYGIVGNDKITNKRFPYLTLLNPYANAGWGSTVGGITETNIGADNLKWERAKKTNIGMDLRLFKDRFAMTIDVFRDYRDGIFQQRTQIPDYVGLLQLPFGNVGEMVSYGADGNFSYNQPIGRNMSFTLRGNFTMSSNMVKNWEQAEPKYPYQRYEGYPLYVTRGYIALGLFRDEQDIKSSPIQSFGGTKLMPGDIKYKDVNGDGFINSDDMVVISYNNYPRFVYGFALEYNYKNLTVGVLFKGTGDNDYYPIGVGYMPFINEAIGNVLTMFADPKSRWTPASYSGDPSTENPNAKFPRLTYGNNANNYQVSTYWRRNARYLRLQDVTINYHLQIPALSVIGIKSIDLQLVGSNLYVWDQVKLFDPEQAGSNGRAYPIPARYTIQAYLNF